MDVLANVTNAMVKKVNERVDGVNEMVCECERRMGAYKTSIKENVVCVVESANGTVSELVSKVKESKECLALVKEDVLHVSGCVDDCVKKVDECVRKVYDYEVGTGVCNERVSVCENKVRDFVSKESLCTRLRDLYGTNSERRKRNE